MDLHPALLRRAAKRATRNAESLANQALTAWTAGSGWSRPRRQSMLPPFLRPPVVVLSPHLDDAVLSCGDLLAALPSGSGPAIVTVFSGAGPGPSAVTDWDRSCGFSAGDDVIAARQREDREAARLLDADPIWLCYPDDQQRDGASAPVEQITERIRSVLDLRQANTVLAPIGVLHPDHRLLHLISLHLSRSDHYRTWVLYKDLPYANEPGTSAVVSASLAEAGVKDETPTWEYGRCSERKLRALMAYRSQLRGLGPRWPAATRDEAYWAITDHFSAGG